MNKRILRIITVLLVLLGVLTGCAFAEAIGITQKETEAGRQYSITIQDSDFFTADLASVTVAQGESFTAELTFLNGFSFESCNYTDCDIEETANGVRLTLTNVQHDYRLVIRSTGSKSENEFPTKTVTIRYYANGGKWSILGECYTETCELSYHYRANTSIGEGLTRTGYTLNGWNTKADGTGEHIGLGSRTDATELYAEWLKWEDAENFTYRRTDGGIALTGYKGAGDRDMLVIPEQIDGMTVVMIESSFTTNIPCGTIASTTLVLPKSIQRIRGNAFVNAAFTEVYFYDSLEHVDENAFSQPITTYHINAASAPGFQLENDNARFADKVDYLMLQEGDRLIVFGGCSVSYGIHSELFAEAFPEYSVCNMGVIGGVNAIFQMQIIGEYLREGDVFLHLPEEMSAFQLMHFISVDYRVLIMVEGNYDLLAQADFSYAVAFWDAYNSYREMKDGQTPGSYADGKKTYNIYGDIAVNRPYEEATAWEQDVTRSDGSYQFEFDYLTEAGIARLCEFYREYEAKGTSVYIGYAPINIDGLQDISAADSYEEQFCGMLKVYGYEPIGKLSEHLFRGRYFYDADYHLNDVGAYLHTNALIAELRAAMGR